MVLTLSVLTLLLDVAAIWLLRSVGASGGRTGLGTLSDLVICGGLLAGARWARNWMIARACVGLVIALGLLAALGRDAPALLDALVGVDIAMRLAWLWALTRPDVVERFR